VKDPRRASFSFFLPLFAALLWVILVAIPATGIFFRLEQQAHGSDVAKIRSKIFEADIPRKRFFSFALNSASMWNSHAIVAINMPGMLGNLPLSIFSWPREWRPTGITMEAWRCIVVPLFCLPAWWFVGRGLDALFGHRCLHWATALSGMVLSILCVVLFTGLRFALSPSERGDVTFPLWGFAIWAGLFAILPAAWLRRVRSRNISKSLLGSK
jgi:hypothetical protein